MEKSFRRKVILTYIVTMLAFAGVVLRIIYIANPDNIKLPSWRSAFQPTLRGSILDRNGSFLALTVSSASIFLRPVNFTNNAATIAALSKASGIPESRINQKIREGSGNFVWLMRQVPEDTGRAVKALDLPGVVVTEEPRRLYPYNELAAHLMGFSGVDHVGLTGLEKSWDNTLLGKDSADGEMHSLILTIDRFVQYIVEDELTEAIRTTGAKTANAIVYQPQTGEILAMASMPSFNLNNFVSYTPKTFVNPNIVQAYEPGSTFKIFTAAFLLKSQMVSYNDRFYCSGSIDLHDHTIKCTRAHGSLNLPGIIKHSCNVGTIKLSQKIPGREFYDFLLDLGFGRPTGSGFPGESGGILGEPGQWSGLSKAMMSIGYEISVTPLQLVRAAGIIGSEGHLMQPRLVKAIADWDGNIITTFQPERLRQVIGAETARDVARMLREAVLPGGTGVLASLPGLEAGGKTGTANIPRPDGLGYYENKYNASFIGFLPYLNSRLVILVVISEPKDTHQGGLIAAPVFQRIASRIFQYIAQKAETKTVQ